MVGFLYSGLLTPVVSNGKRSIKHVYQIVNLAQIGGNHDK